MILSTGLKSHARVPLRPFLLPYPPPPLRRRRQACGVCYSDCYVVLGEFGAKYPTAPGHEVVGKVRDRYPKKPRWSQRRSLDQSNVVSLRQSTWVRHSVCDGFTLAAFSTLWAGLMGVPGAVRAACAPLYPIWTYSDARYTCLVGTLLQRVPGMFFLPTSKLQYLLIMPSCC